ncbi:MAG: methionyl-tRNA formyltransferase [Treponema sp.]|nr:methionyl-tRNA formyltransferase [Treponema sp.]
MRVLFAGSPAIAVPCLEALFAAEGVTLAGVLTNPDSPRGRSGRHEPTDVAAAAERLGQAFAPVPVLKSMKLDAAAREQVTSLAPDLLVSFAYGKIFGPKFLGLFPLGGINIHPSLLPKYRGPTPIQAAILNRDSKTGISVQRLAQKMDSGDILIQEHLQLTGAETAGELSETMALKAAALLPPLLGDITAGKTKGEPQNHSEASYCSLIESAHGLVDWSKSAPVIEAEIRAYNPWPLSWTLHKGARLFFLKAKVYENGGGQIDAGVQAGTVLGADREHGILIQTGDGVIVITELQYQNRKALEWRAFMNGARNFTGTRLG